MEEDSPYNIAIARSGGHHPDCDERIAQAVREALRRHHAEAARISVAVVDDRRMAELNRAHLGHAGPTDVLTYDLRDNDDDPLEGDIVVSADTAAREAARRGHGIGAELALYAVHGTLHLLGYSDHTETEAAAMHAAEDDILAALGIGRIFQGEGK